MVSAMDEFAQTLAEIGNIRSFIPGTSFVFGTASTDKIHIRTPGSDGDQFVISWILTGSGSFVENGHEYQLHDGCFCLRRPGRDFRMFVDKKPSCRLFFDIPYSFYQTFALLIPELEQLPPVKDVRFRRSLYDEFMSIVRDLWKSTAMNYYTLLPRLIHYILDLTGIAADRAGSPMLLARSMLEDTSSRLTLEEIALSCGMKYDSFRKRFSSTYGISPGQYRISCRIEAARNALAAGESIAEVSERLGFPDVYTFTHRFKAVVGVSPARYRGDVSE